MDSSKLKLFSLGLVIEDKKRRNTTIKVSPIEELPFQEGDISKQSFKNEIKIKDADDKVQVSKLEGDNYLLAKWLPYGQSNRISPPDVIKGETVLIFRFSDTDEYYWTTLFNNPSIRRQETATYVYGNISKGRVPWGKDSSYYFEISTHDKHIKLHTSKNDNELCSYDIVLNTDKGFLIIEDNLKNSIMFDSKLNKFTFNPNEEFEINTKDIEFNTDTMTINSKKFVLNSDNTTINSEVTCNGNTTFNGGVSISGDLSVGGGVAAGGVVSGSNI